MGLDDLWKKAVGAGHERVRETAGAALGEIRGLRPFLARCGFVLAEVRLTLSIPPGVAATVEESGVAAESIAHVLADPKLTPFQRAVVSSLQKAYDLQGTAAANGLRIAKVVLEISVPPSVEVHFVPTLVPDEP